MYKYVSNIINMRVPNMRKYVIIGLASYLILQFHSRETKEISLEG